MDIDPNAVSILGLLGPDVFRFQINRYLMVCEIARVLCTCKLLKAGFALSPSYEEAKNKDYYHPRKQLIVSILLSLRLYSSNSVWNQVSYSV